VVLCCFTSAQELADLERRAQAAELRHQDLSEKLPEATAPLLRQISALQDASAAQAHAWTAAERALTRRLQEAEAAAAAAAEREAVAAEAAAELQASAACVAVHCGGGWLGTGARQGRLRCSAAVC
jgi:hypothetical protein